MTAREDSPARSAPDALREDKRALRRRLLDARKARSDDDRAAATAALTRHVLALAEGVDGPVCCYLPVGPEPGAAGSGTSTVADALLAAGHEVLAPVVPAEPGPLDWTRYEGADSLVTGPLGVREPGGERLGVEAITRAGLVLVPALAVDGRGRRIGRGGGYYDRTLPAVPASTPLAVLLHDDELIDHVPAGDLDVTVAQVILPTRGAVAVRNNH
ncbi:5-formyltetrahydrofolate cyclo-ligase [Pseudonocardia sediminis]|uniref:5-formyltetrahydrofolate cyclo-ligase n=1 Tax=Pseudonocardia sediminis TaxID=1397368 RepID=A0A4Q7UV13_PSEST|nr:5-formyltetrahydrofolate cyclo-ligase [Pseudonocardia sediminis]RZT83879.1 5-formyltetrahydrofolate cyclo-ligase [Pseudonocardia sediminis]